MSVQSTNHLVVVGGGLVGSALAMFLRKQGFPVTIIERRGDPNEGPVDSGRSINLVVTRKGLNALEKLGLRSEVLAITVPVAGRMMHSLEGQLTFQPYGRDETEQNYSVSRSELNALLLRKARNCGVQVEFETELTELDPEAKTLTIVSQKHRRKVVKAARVFGVDGSGSQVRNALNGLGIIQSTTEFIDFGYKELLIASELAKSLKLNALHIWPRGHHMLMTLPNCDGSATVTLWLPFSGDSGFHALNEPKKVQAFFEREFCDAVELIPDLSEQFFQNPVGKLGTVRCHPWHYKDWALLMGDAAHGIVPLFGQGMNAGLEDCVVLEALVEALSSNWGKVFEAYSNTRKVDCDAIADMSLENFIEMREHVGDPRFLLRKKVEAQLEKRFPLQYRSRYGLVVYTLTPYSVAKEAGRIQAEILNQLCDGISTENEVDYEKAKVLITNKLSPFYREHGVLLS